MEEYIPKSAVVAELDRLYNLEYDNTSNLSCGKKIMLRKILSFLDTLEVKEVDLEEEMRNYIINHYRIGSDTLEFDLNEVIKHFFELGLKAQKGE